MATLPSQVATHFIVTNIGPIISSVLSSAYSSYTTPVQHPNVVRQETDDERELDLLQMERLLKWMRFIFDDSHPSSERDTAYKKELYNIYVTICSDHIQYQQWKKYNDSLWMFSSMRKKNTKELARKILADIKLFKEGLEMFSMFQKI